MSGMEFNKIMAAVLVAGITATFAGFIAREAIHPKHLHENAVKIEGVGDEGSSGPVKPKGPEPILGLIADADVSKGAQISKVCAACHVFDKGGPNGTGPNLWGVINRPKGSHPGFDYSDGMKNKGGKWDYESLNHFLYKPKAYVDGTKMNFIGLKKAKDRAEIIAWLRTLSDNPAPLPSEADIAAEQAELAPPPDNTDSAGDAAEGDAAPAE